MPMVIDTRTRSTVSGFVPGTLDPMDQSSALPDALHQPRDLKKSLAASDQAVSRPYKTAPRKRKKEIRWS